jgi:GNAT superfamily N-acetyltransferase
MPTKVVALLSEAECQELESFLADRIYEFNSQATGYFDGKLLAGSIRDDWGKVIAGFSGHTWGGCCYISHVWVHEQHRGKGLGKTLLQVAETEARHRDCMQVVLLTHSFQAPRFYEHLGYERKYAIEGRPKGHSDIFPMRLALLAPCPSSATIGVVGSIRLEPGSCGSGIRGSVKSDLMEAGNR